MQLTWQGGRGAELAGEQGWHLLELCNLGFATAGLLLPCGQPCPLTPGPKLPAECIPGYPDQNLPTVLLYRDTKCLQTMVGLRHFGGRGTSPELVRAGSQAGRGGGRGREGWGAGGGSGGVPCRSWPAEAAWAQ